MVEQLNLNSEYVVWQLDSKMEYLVDQLHGFEKGYSHADSWIRTGILSRKNSEFLVGPLDSNRLLNLWRGAYTAKV